APRWAPLRPRRAQPRKRGRNGLRRGSPDRRWRRWACAKSTTFLNQLPKTGSKSSADLLAHQRHDALDLARELGELRGRDLLRPVRERLLGARMRLDDDSVGPDRGRRAREWENELALPGRVRRIADHAQMRALPQHR